MSDTISPSGSSYGASTGTPALIPGSVVGEWVRDLTGNDRFMQSTLLSTPPDSPQAPNSWNTVIAVLNDDLVNIVSAIIPCGTHFRLEYMSKGEPAITALRSPYVVFQYLNGRNL